MTESTQSLSASEVSRRFGDVHALTDVSLEVPRSSVTAVIGPNGSGKTTLLRLMAGLLDPDSGHLERPDAGVRPIGFLPQRPSFRPRFTVRETLNFYRRLAGAPPAAVDDVLETVGLTGASDREVQTLSGGMTGLLGIAQGLMGGPPYLILDEPTTGLDPGIKRSIFEVIDTLRSEGHGILLASHDLERIGTHADRVVLLETGHTRVQGPIEDVLESAGVTPVEALYHVQLTGDPGTIEIRRSQQ